MKLKATKGEDVKEGAKFDLQEFMNTLNTLDPQNIGSWPLAAKVLVYVIVFVVVLVLGYVLDLSAMRETYASASQKLALKVILRKPRSKVPSSEFSFQAERIQ